MFDLSGKRVWVAGHNGMVGGAIARRLASEDCDVLTVGRAELSRVLTAAGFLGGFAAFAFVGFLGLKSLRLLRPAIKHPGWRFAVTALQRRTAATVVQIVALSLGLMALLLLTVMVSQPLVRCRR